MPTADMIIDDPSLVFRALQPKIKNFCREYIIDFNGKRAAIRAGYSSRTAASMASQLLTKLNVSVVVQWLVKQKADRLDLTAERTMEEVARISFVDARVFFDDDGKLKKPKNWPAQWAGAVASYNAKKQEITFHPKNPALTLAARIVKIVDSDAVPISMQGNFVVIAPADSSPDQWKTLAAAQMIAAKNGPQLVSTNGHQPVHTNGDGE